MTDYQRTSNIVRVTYTTDRKRVFVTERHVKPEDNATFTIEWHANNYASFYGHDEINARQMSGPHVGAPIGRGDDLLRRWIAQQCKTGIETVNAA